MRLLLLLCFLLPVAASGQTDYDMDQLAIDAPANSHLTVEQLATYFVKNIPDDRGRVRAIFAWVTLNIRYLDTSNQSEIWATPEHLDRQRPEKVMKNRTAVCQGFANLFQALAEAAGIESQVVTGIVKNDEGEVMRVGHAWASAFVQDSWYLFDPTWSVPRPGERWRVNDRYFMVAPERFVLSHLPDDPAWQLLENPLRETDFRENNAEGIRALLRETPDVAFNFSDTLKNWIALDSVSRNFSAESRILQFNGGNQRVLFGLGQNYWGQFFDIRAHLDSMADRAILHEGFSIDTLTFTAQLDLMDRYHNRARALFSLITDPVRQAQTEKFYTPDDVAAISAKLRGAMWTALFENHFTATRNEVNESNLQDLLALAEAAEQQYNRSRSTLDCTKLIGTCYEILHNLSLADLQLAERYSLFCQNLLSEKNPYQYLKTIAQSNATAQMLLQKAEVATRQMLLIPPPYAFVRERLLSIRQGLQTVKVHELGRRRVALNPQVEAALAPSKNTTVAAKSMIGQLQGVAESLADLLQTIEDAYGDLGAEYCDATLFNLHQEGYAIRFNLASLNFRAALDFYQDATGKNTLEAEKKRIKAQAQNALPLLQEARESLEFIERSGKGPKNSTEQRILQINKLSKSVREFSDTL